MGEFNDDDEFYFYGKEDEIVLKKTLHKITNPNGISLISHVLNHIIDYSLEVKSHFQVTKPIALIKLVEYYRQERIRQNHNALEDARYLHYIYNQILLESEPVNTDAFDEYKSNNVSTNVINRVDDNDNVLDSYPSFSEALTWIINVARKAGRQLTDRQAIRGKLAHAIKFGTKYYGFYWIKEGKHLKSLDI